MNNYRYIILNYTSASKTSKSVALLTWIFYISHMQSVNGAQVLNITSLSLLSGSHTIYLVNASRALSPLLTVLVPLRSIHASQCMVIGIIH